VTQRPTDNIYLRHHREEQRYLERALRYCIALSAALVLGCAALLLLGP
jgi:hypothetical protein